ncbi:NAD(P)-dependent oxidoreductase [Novosphingopyxis sp.]|uniref:NAD(P)-dependent oxidoreductase n=1 Tax=Novosphingopyxis sp. TaxID=2709690 RepID=UPI003B5A1F0C
MKIALIGATGYVGAKLLAEALDRGHQVTAIVTDVGKLSDRTGLTGVSADATDSDVLSRDVAGHDVVISAYNPGRDTTGTATQAIVNGVKRGGVSRFLVVGGAGSLSLPNGERVVDQPDFPIEWKIGALATAAFLDQLRGETGLDWVFLSPAAMLTPGERTGHYRSGKDDLLTDDAGDSRISLEDYAVAMLDEAEHPKHHRERFTVAY